MHAQTAQVVEKHGPQTGNHADEHKIQQPFKRGFEIKRTHVKSDPGKHFKHCEDP
jgi:hypothetical protein